MVGPLRRGPAPSPRRPPPRTLDWSTRTLMNVTVFGATGAIGSLTVAELLDRGHTVTAYARNPRKVPSGWGERVRVVIGEMSDADAIDTAVTGADAVVSALGPSMDRKATGLPLVEGTRHILDAMKRHRVTRYIGHGTPSVLDPHEKPTLQTRLIGFLGRTLLRRAYDELLGMTASSRPPQMTASGGPSSGSPHRRTVRSRPGPTAPGSGSGSTAPTRSAFPSPAPTSPRSPPPKSTTTPTSTARPPSATDPPDSSHPGDHEQEPPAWPSSSARSLTAPKR